MLTGCDSLDSNGFRPGIDCSAGTADCKLSSYSENKKSPLFSDCDSATCGSGTVTNVDYGLEYTWARLFNSSGTAVPDGVVMTSSDSFARARSANTLSLSEATNYTVRVQSSDANNTATVSAARLLYTQTNGTKLTATQSTFEIGNNETTTGTSYVPLTDSKFYYYDSSVFTPTPTFYFEATLSNNTGGSIAYAALYQSGASCTSVVSGSEVTVTGTTWALSRSSAITLTNATEYMVCVKASANTARIATAKIVADQSAVSGIAALQTAQQYNNTLITQSTSTYTSKGYLNNFTKSNFTGGTFTGVFESDLKTSNGANAYFARNDQSLGEVTAADTTYTRKRSSDIWSSMPASSTNIDVQIRNASTFTTSSSNSWFIISVSGLPSGPTTAEQLRLGNWFSGGVEQYFVL